MSQTACPHCGSTNSIETAGQRYCADCGQLISEKKKATAKDVKKDTPKKIEKQIDKKAEKKTEAKPKPHAVSQNAPAKPRPAAPPLNLKAIEDARKAPAPSVARPGVLDLKNTAHKPAPTRVPVGRHVPPAKKVEKAEPVIAKPQVSQIADVRVPVLGKKFRHKTALRDAFKSIKNSRTLGIALIATLITTICEVIFVTMFAKTGMYAITETIAAGSINAARATTLVGHAAWASLLGFFGYLVYHYGLAEIIFRTSKTFDRRNASAQQVRRAALGSLAGMFVIDVLTWVLAIVTILLTTGANLGFIGTKSLGVAGIALAMLVNIVTIYLWLGLISARHMATYAIILGQVGVRRAYSTGWALFNRQFGRIVSGLMVVVAASFIIALPASLFHNMLGSASTFALILTTTITAVTQAAVMIVGSIYFLRLYRFVIAQEYDSELGHLLSGRQPRRSHIGRRLAALGGITVLWVAIMTIIILNSSALAQVIIR
jgi:transcription initiation factor TFIIIB Brf1 subunit/transcription initiation factor TFIIB